MLDFSKSIILNNTTKIQVRYVILRKQMTHGYIHGSLRVRMSFKFSKLKKELTFVYHFEDVNISIRGTSIALVFVEYKLEHYTMVCQYVHNCKVFESIWRFGEVHKPNLMSLSLFQIKFKDISPHNLYRSRMQMANGV